MKRSPICGLMCIFLLSGSYAGLDVGYHNFGPASPNFIQAGHPASVGPDATSAVFTGTAGSTNRTCGNTGGATAETMLADGFLNIIANGGMALTVTLVHPSAGALLLKGIHVNIPLSPA